MSTRFTVTGNLKPETGKEIIIGRSFAFLSGKALSSTGYSWMERLFGARNKAVSPHIISLLGSEAVDLFGVSIEPTKVPSIVLGAVISDKSLYAAEKDRINVLVVRPLEAGCKSRIHLNSGGALISKHEVSLDRNGAGKLQLCDLTAGDYDLVMEGESEPACQFVVAEYKLVPLVANLLSRTQDKDGQLTFKLQLESFGVPVNGEVKLDLMDRHIRLSSFNVMAENGEASATFALTGPGPHSIVAQVVSDQAKTASFPLRGSREAERSFTCFSPLGNVVSGSLLPSENSTVVRGIHLFEEGAKTAPVTLERVDAGIAKLTVHEDIETLKVVAITPVAQKSSVACDPKTSMHPEHVDREYQAATEMFHRGEFQKACETFEGQRAKVENPHCYYSYWIACCQAKMGQTEKALNSLRRSVREGWYDFVHMRLDDDLASLRECDEFQRMVERGQNEFDFHSLSAGQKLEIQVTAPVTLLAIGALINGKAWEGWASMLPPSEVTGTIELEKVCNPGEEITIKVRSSSPRSTVYAVVKDARLLSTDTAEVKLAAGLKNFVDEGLNSSPPQFGNDNLWDIFEKIGRRVRANNFDNLFEGYSPDYFDNLPQRPAGQLMGRLVRPASAPPVESSGWGEVPLAYAASPVGGADYSPVQALSGAADYETLLAQPVGAAAFDAAVASGLLLDSVPKPVAAPHSSDSSKPDDSSVVVTQNDPEVLYAGFVATEHGVATLSIRLPDCFADYIVECFLVAGMDWTTLEHRFSAKKDCFIHLSTPVFAKENESCLATVFVRTPDVGRLKLLCDNKPVVLLDRTLKPLSEEPEVASGEGSFRFKAIPGNYQAVLENDGKILAEASRRVDETGKLRRVVRSLRIAEKGETVSLSDNSAIRALSVAPGIETSFEVLVEATINYEHCCCEQTAARLLSACAMYSLAGADDDRARSAEAAIIAGVKREEKMWLPGRGFKAYPERENQPDTYYGPKAARYLWNLGLLTELNTRGSGDLNSAIVLGLKMAEDTTRAYGLAFPPSSLDTCEDAYAALRFGANGHSDAALEVARARAEVRHAPVVQPVPCFGVNVQRRIENAYASAALIRGKHNADLPKALALANTVISDFNEQGRLYSTADSVAAIALMSELNAAGILEGGGVIEINGSSMVYAEAVNCTEPIRSVKVVDGIATVLIDRVVENDWNSYASNVPLRVSLEKNGKHTRKLTAGDAVELVVQLEEGYKMGDLLWIALPDALSRIFGGGQVKLFSLDFQGLSELRVSLAVTGTTAGADGDGEQSLALCVRNMFDEERAGSPGLIAISAKG